MVNYASVLTRIKLGSKTSKLDVEGFMWAVSMHVRVGIQNCSWNWGTRLLQRLMRRQEDNIQMELNDIGMVLAESAGANGIQGQPFVNMVMNPGFHKRQGMWRHLVWSMCTCIPNCTASHFRGVVFCSHHLENFISHKEILARLNDSFSGHGWVELIILTCGSVGLFKIRVQLRLSFTRLSVGFYQPSCWRAALCCRCWRKSAYVPYHMVVPSW
jgi:hypothetical protein